MPEILVHHLEKSRSLRILWLLEELELPYEVKLYRRTPAFRAPPELKQVHPLGKAPVVEVDGVQLLESGAITETLVEDWGPHLKPRDPEAMRRYRYWMHYAEGSLMPPLLLRLILGKVRSAPLPFFVKPIARGVVDKVESSYTQPELDLHLAWLQSNLNDHSWFAGSEFSAADVQMSYPVQGARERGGLDQGQPAVLDWLARIEARPAYLRAVAKTAEIEASSAP